MAENRGRPRSFSSESALEEALGLFWQAGYLGTSYVDICAATGLTKPSLYAAFGNKEEMFLASLELYLSRYIRPGIDILTGEPDPREAIRKLLTATVAGLTAKGTPPGCMIATNAACASAPGVPQAISNALLAAAKETPNAIADRLADASMGQLPPGADIKSVTAYFEALISGLSALAKQGATRRDLARAVNTAMLIW